MTEQPTALRLADALRDGVSYDEAEIENELRRLHAENDAFGIHLSERMKDLALVEAQRDALLEACRFYASMMGRRTSNNEPFYMTALDLDCGDRARAAIKAVEENT